MPRLELTQHFDNLVNPLLSSPKPRCVLIRNDIALDHLLVRVVPGLGGLHVREGVTRLNLARDEVSTALG